MKLTVLLWLFFLISEMICRGISGSVPISFYMDTFFQYPTPLTAWAYVYKTKHWVIYGQRQLIVWFAQTRYHNLAMLNLFWARWIYCIFDHQILLTLEWCGFSNFALLRKRAWLYCVFKSMVADDLAMQEGRASSRAWLYRNARISAPERLNHH